MTERKPPGAGFESWVDRQIREAAERGDFDNLPGAGKPLPGRGTPDDELWWIRGWVHREGLSGEALLPTALRLRGRVERLADDVRELPSEQSVRRVAGELNESIEAWLRHPDGPWVPLRPVDVDEVVRVWRADRAGPARATAAPAADSAPPPRRRWWQIVRPRRRAG